MPKPKKKPGRPPGSKNKSKNSNKTNTKAKVDQVVEKHRVDRKLIDEIWAISCIAVGIFIFAAMQFNAAGQFGNMIGDFLKGIFGIVAYILPWYLMGFGTLLFLHKTVHLTWKTAVLVFVVLLMLCLLNSVRFIDEGNLKVAFSTISIFYAKGITLKGGGVFGMFCGTLLIKAIGKTGLYIFSIVLILICILLVLNTPISKRLEILGEKRRARKLVKEQEEAEREVQREAYLSEQKETVTPILTNSYTPPTPTVTPVVPQRDIKIITPFSGEQTQIEPKNLETTKTQKKHGKNNIMKYMTDDTLFGENNSGPSVTTYGLDGKESLEPQGTSGTEIHNNEKTVEKMSNKEAREAILTPMEISVPKKHGKYQKPPIDLLNKSVVNNVSDRDSNLKEKAQKLEETLKNFHVDARVVQVTQGPAVTRYEIQPNVGVKVNSIVRLSDDIALNLEAKSIRIEAPIPGKAAVGIEVENDSVNMVTIRDIVGSKEFKTAKSKITFAVGKDIAGKAIVTDLKDMPHLLIAGSTGSGKSVCINSIITSILFKATPEEVKFVLIDPKVVELGNYNGIPHLLIPVVTEPPKAAAALNWAVAEMNDRYKKFAEESVRDLQSFNEAVIANDESDRVLPQIVIIIDELADLMMAAPSQVEESICRLAQMARAAGMHLIVATQRPSVDIITGVIKANIPSRIAFAVSSQFDSRTILDMGGAEKLVGKGDMLFNPLGMGKPIRVQGTFISDSEVHKVIEYVKSQVDDVEYSNDVMHTIEKSNTPSQSDDADELLNEAIECVVKAGQASVSMLQRRFRIGYNRAARIVDMMEDRGIIGPSDGSRPRQVLMSEDEFQQLERETEDI
ncbi:MAG: DNA translocase FtsK [Anaerovoracaceae bacterium]